MDIPPSGVASEVTGRMQRPAGPQKPCLKHLPLAKAVFGLLGAPWVLKAFHPEPEPTGSPGSCFEPAAPPRTQRPSPVLAAWRWMGHAPAGAPAPDRATEQAQRPHRHPTGWATGVYRRADQPVQRVPSALDD